MIAYKFLIVVLVMSLLISCSSPNSLPTQYYQLVVDNELSQEFESTGSYFIDISEIPEVLKRQSIVSYKSSKSGLLISKNHLWAADLQELIAQSIKTSLKNQFPKSDFYTSRKYFDASDEVIDIKFHEFAGELGQQVFLNVRWQISGSDWQKTQQSHNLPSDRHIDYVMALSKMLSVLSKDIGLTISTHKNNK